MAHRILLVEDDARLAKMVADYLAEAGFRVSHAPTGAEAELRLQRETFDALVLDLMLPDTDGLDLCRRIRAHSSIPVLMLTARGDPLDRVVGLELGADDYLPKPFEPRELLARVRALLRRAAPTPADDDVLRFGRLEIDLGERVARLDGRPCVLRTADREVDVLRAAARGLNRKQMAEALVISEATVRHHLEHIYDKTGARTRVAAILFAMENDLLP